jgi:hypothetical protein
MRLISVRLKCVLPPLPSLSRQRCERSSRASFCLRSSAYALLTADDALSLGAA